jgi:hypothetical protein
MFKVNKEKAGRGPPKAERIENRESKLEKKLGGDRQRRRELKIENRN